jgi:hypothetical protein
LHLFSLLSPLSSSAHHGENFVKLTEKEGRKEFANALEDKSYTLFGTSLTKQVMS